MAEWIVLNNDEKLNPGGFYRNNFRYGFEDMENCDLPPPLKVFEGPEKTITALVAAIDDHDRGGDVRRSGLLDKEKSELSKALTLSQSRAREADNRVEILSKLMIQESMQCFAYKQWVKLMEFRISKLENKLKEKEKEKEKNGMAWFVAVALCLGIAGFGFTFQYPHVF